MSSTDDPPEGPKAEKSAPSRRRTRGSADAAAGSATTIGAGKGAGKRSQRGIIAVGAVLNGIYEVRRLIARGGMGEVYEGVNVNADERVAIKVILPHLAADPNVQAMFRKEARTLTSFAHPALVQYRVLAREPRRDLLYIVTDFIDGEPLLNLVGKLRPTPSQLAMLTRRLAEGLAAAHGHGAIHRDISPENILLPGNDLSRAKIIDFGIAKSLEVGAQTVVGDGFAGKLGYVAPEQFGDFGRNVGPWTDIYSLALVILGLAAGKAPDMGATLVEAIDRRRAGPDISALPASLAPIFASMLAANPVDRPQSMRDVIDALDKVSLPADSPADIAAAFGGVGAANEAATVFGDAESIAAWRSAAPHVDSTPSAAEPASPAPVDPTVFAPAGTFTPEPTPQASQPPEPPPVSQAAEPASAAWAPSAAPEAAAPPPEPPAAPSEPAPKPAEPQPAAEPAKPPPPPKPEKPLRPPPEPKPADDVAGTGRRPPVALIGGIGAVALAGVLAAVFWPKKQADVAPPAAPVITQTAALPSLTTALTKSPCAWVDAGRGADGRVTVVGVAADPTAVNTAAAAAMRDLGQAGADIDTSSVLRAASSACPVLDAAAPLHKPISDSLGLTAQQGSFEVDNNVPGCPVGRPSAQAIATLNVDPAKGFALVGIEPSGQLRQLVASREEFLALTKRNPNAFTDLGGGRYRVALCQANLGVAGLLALSGDGPFDLGLRSGAATRPSAALTNRLSAGAAKGWAAQIAWFRVVDAQPNRAPTPVTTILDGTRIVEGEPLPAAPGVEPTAPPPPVVAVDPVPPTRAAADWQACRRFRGGAWEEMGFGNQAECLQRIFVGQCDVLSGRFGETDLRRYNGQIQAGSGGRFSRRWTNIAASDCK